MTIRKSLPSDATALYKLEQELFSAENFPLSRGSFVYHIKNNLLYVAEMDGVIVAYVLVLIKRSDAKLYSIGVSQSCRGKNIAQELLTKVIQELTSLKFTKLLLEVRTDNEAAISLYAKLGFHTVKLLKRFYLDGCDAHLMELNYADKTLHLSL
ncbi:MAG: ribosomal-protein-alanine N-acetyltransferase [Helicobacteraceae bacterium CG2_30_36_10]|nr:MAG: ribosomal-protein-alanine N-acetyltransferase [Helicobacteraceae bacterium CG2_30_36_10]